MVDLLFNAIKEYLADKHPECIIHKSYSDYIITDGCKRRYIIVADEMKILYCNKHVFVIWYDYNTILQHISNILSEKHTNVWDEKW